MIFVACFELISSLVVIYKKNNKKISIHNSISRKDKLCMFKIMQLLIYCYAIPSKVKKSVRFDLTKISTASNSKPVLNYILTMNYTDTYSEESYGFMLKKIKKRKERKKKSPHIQLKDFKCFSEVSLHSACILILT